MTSGNQFSRAELEEMITKMTAVSGAFYSGAVRTGCHTFIEFTGLMNEFIKVCHQSMVAGVDFALASTHSGVPLVVHDYNAAYIAEKLDCILGPTLRASPEVTKAFLDGMGLSENLSGNDSAALREATRLAVDAAKEALARTDQLQTRSAKLEQGLTALLEHTDRHFRDGRDPLWTRRKDDEIRALLGLPRPDPRKSTTLPKGGMGLSGNDEILGPAATALLKQRNEALERAEAAEAEIERLKQQLTEGFRK